MLKYIPLNTIESKVIAFRVFINEVLNLSLLACRTLDEMIP